MEYLITRASPYNNMLSTLVDSVTILLEQTDTAAI